eukprot:CAMPEP_0114540980 /NCGR_PEP_ID=MMETSP0114-20121206/1061_1 /TAXON_ID=31324 /ORGANISM="Goniomonas sp, Strain m" /LENGTH=268 /DNA_ID=CAMNT_0001725187 /DNA_START=20 /DNA_END=826 /DNA_ORIENTATION=+
MNDAIDDMHKKIGDKMSINKHIIDEGVVGGSGIPDADGRRIAKIGVPENFMGADVTVAPGKKPIDGFVTKDTETPYNKKKEDEPSPELDAAWLEEINSARTDPRAFAAHFAPLIPQFKDQIWKRPGRNPIRTHEGVAAVHEAVAFLEKQDPVGKLEFCPGMHKAATELTTDMGTSGGTGHDSADGSDTMARLEKYGEVEDALGELCSYGFSNARMGVMQLLLDDGDPSRNNRTNLFNPDFKIAAVNVGTHTKLEFTATIVLGGAWEDN